MKTGLRFAQCRTETQWPISPIQTKAELRIAPLITLFRSDVCLGFFLTSPLISGLIIAGPTIIRCRSSVFSMPDEWQLPRASGGMCRGVSTQYHPGRER